MRERKIKWKWTSGKRLQEDGVGFIYICQNGFEEYIYQNGFEESVKNLLVLHNHSIKHDYSHAIVVLNSLNIIPV